MARFQRIDPDRIGDVLEILRPEVGDLKIEPRFDLPIGVLGEADPAPNADSLESGGDVHAVAHEIAVALLDHVADMIADAELDAPGPPARRRCVR